MAKKSKKNVSDESQEPQDGQETEDTQETFGEPEASNLDAGTKGALSGAEAEADKKESVDPLSADVVFENVGKIVNPNTTDAHIEIVQNLSPALLAARRAEATERALADGSLKPEDAPGAQVPEGGVNINDGGNPEHGNSRTDAPDFITDPHGEKRDAVAAEADASTQLTATQGSNADGSITSTESRPETETETEPETPKEDSKPADLF